jgi:protein phosphatase methylesterase 1
MSIASSPAAAPLEVDGFFTNGKDEKFHYTVFAPSITAVPPANTDGSVPVLLCVHGAGMSGDCFFRLARELQRRADASSDGQSSPMPASPALSGRGVSPLSQSVSLAMELAAETRGDDMDMHIITYDQRCHGQSTFAGGEDHLEIELLMDDFIEFLQYAKQELFPHSHFFLMGHSLGGAVVARALSSNKAAQERVSGVIMVDIVEGTALMSLSHMTEYLKKRPNSFPSVEDAEAWFLHLGGMQNAQGAAVSVPPLLRQNPETGMWHWRTDLRKMESVWGGWFKGLDAAFVSLPCAKMLCTANAERLDKALTVAQMQGKFQFEIIGNGCGHHVMDDATATVAAKVRRFVKRNEVLAQKLRLMNKRIPTHYNNTTIPPNRV